MSSDERDADPPAPLPFEVPGTLTRPPNAVHLRTQALPALWQAWSAAAAAMTAGEAVVTDDIRARLLATFDAAVTAFAEAARAQGATVTAIVRLLSLFARAAEDEVAVDDAPRTRRDALRDRAGRIAMAAYYQSPEA
ncbi:MAG TPA: hypothetical protein VEZ47_13515 [Gemmatirosa sp.]|nr:hypothetical protein [Gemmatirosa sp.]